MYIIFKRGSRVSLLDVLVRYLTHGPFAHCELLFSDGHTFTSYMGPGTGFYPFGDAPFYARGSGTADQWCMFELRMAKGDEELVRRFCAVRLANLPYNYAGMVCLPFFHVGHLRKSAFCSEACTSALQRVGMLCRANADRISPNELFRQLSRWNCIDRVDADDVRRRFSKSRV
jgi:hypothetical protein